MQAPEPIYDDKVQEVYALRRDAAKQQADWRMDAREDYNFRDGEQWDSEDKATLEEQGRPIVTFNRVAPIIDAVAGYELNNRQEVKYKPRGLTGPDTGVSELYSNAARWVRDRCDAEDEESEAFRDAITCGMGWTEIRVDYEEDPNGQIIKERIPPLEMRWDRNSAKANLADRMWDMREKWLTIREIKERWPDKADDIDFSSDTMWDDEWPEEHDATDAWKYEQDRKWITEKGDKALVIHYQYKERQPYVRVGDPESGEVVEFSPDRWERIREVLEEEGVELPVHTRQNRWVYKQCFVVGRVLLEEGDAPTSGFSRTAITGKRDEEHGVFFGLMRAMKDPQRWANKFFSQTMHILGANAKGGIIAEESAIPDLRKFEENWARPDGISIVEDGALTAGRIDQKNPPAFPTALDKLLSFSITSIRDTTGINLELLGLTDRDQSGVLEQERKQSALTILAPLANSLRRYRKISGRTLLDFMRKYIPQGTYIRISEPDGTEKYAQFVPDDDTVKYDIVVDTAPNSPNLKSEVWGALQNMVPAMVKAGVPIPPELVRFSPLPESIAENWIKFIKESKGVPKELQQKMQQLQEALGKAQQENFQLKNKQQQHLQDLQHKREAMLMEREQEQFRILMEQKSKEMELLFKKEIADADRQAKLIEIEAKYNIEINKLKEHTAAERERAAREIAHKREENALDREAEKNIKEMEHVEFQAESVAPHLSRLEKLEAKLDEDREAREKTKSAVLDYLKSKGRTEIVERLENV